MAGLAAARALAAVAGPLFADGSAGMADFEKPSNPVFQPPEYRSTNCCMPFACEFCVPTGGGFCYGGGVESAGCEAVFSAPEGVRTFSANISRHTQFEKCQWGVIQLPEPVLMHQGYCAETVWKTKIKKAFVEVRQGVRLPDGVEQVTSDLIADIGSCAELEVVRNSLTNRVGCDERVTPYYMIEAVQAHEDLHVRNYLADMTLAFESFRSAVESLSIPAADASNPTEAEGAIASLPEFEEAVTTFDKAHYRSKLDELFHVNPRQYRAAELAAVRPMLTLVDSRRAALGCD